MAKFTDAVRATLQGHFDIGDQPTEAQFDALVLAIQEGIEEHAHDGTGDGDGIANLVGLTGLSVGTAVPGFPLVLAAAADNAIQVIRAHSVTDGDAPSLFFRKSHHDTIDTLDDTTDGDILGDIRFYGVDTGPGWAFGARILATQVGAAGAALVETDLVLYTHSTTASNTNQLVLDGGAGDVGVGCAPTFRLDVFGNKAAAWLARFFNDGNTVDRHGIVVQCGADDPATVGTTYFLLARDGDGGSTGSLKSVNGVFQLEDISDERRKTNIIDTKLNGLDVINGLRVRDYNWKRNPKGPVMTSFVAQEAQEVYPDMVGEMPDGTLSTSRAMLIPILTKAVQELDARLTQGGL